MITLRRPTVQISHFVVTSSQVDHAACRKDLCASSLQQGDRTPKGVGPDHAAETGSR